MNKLKRIADEAPPADKAVLTWADNTDGCGGFIVAEMTAGGYWSPTGNISSYDAECFHTPTHWTELPPEPEDE